LVRGKKKAPSIEGAFCEPLGGLSHHDKYQYLQPFARSCLSISEMAKNYLIFLAPSGIKQQASVTAIA